MARVAIYARKSSESEDKQAKSIEEQLTWAQKRAEELGEPNPEIYQESRSASDVGRPEFARLMDAINAGRVNTIVTWKADRLSRNPVDGGAILYAISKRQLEIVTSDRRYSQSDEQFLLTVEFGISAKYSQDLSKNVVRGLAHKRERGEWTSFAPFGYLNITSERERREKGGAIIVDDAAAPYVRKLFELVATGNYSLRDLTELATETWHVSFRRASDRRTRSTYPLTTIERILKNPFYYGAMRIKGQLYQGSHTPLVSKALFDIVQDVLAGRRTAAERPSVHSFPFTGLIVCANCGYRYTAYTKRKKSGKTYTYYRCSKNSKGCDQPPVNASEVLAVVTPALARLTITPAQRDACIEILHELNRDEADFATTALDKLRKQEAALVEKKKRLLDAFIERAVTREEKDALSARYEEERTALELQIRQAEGGQAEWIELAENFFKALTDADVVFDVAENDEKRALLRTFRIELRATRDKLLVDAGNATTIVMNRGGRPVWRNLVRQVRTSLIEAYLASASRGRGKTGRRDSTRLTAVASATSPAP